MSHAASSPRVDVGRWRVVVTGGAGFLGSHLCERLVSLGAHVVAVDNLLTGRRDNVAHLLGNDLLTVVDRDVTRGLRVRGRVDAVLHFSSPASPGDYLRLPIQTLKAGALGTHNALGLARAKRARFLLASTSEVYGDPQVHPQPESYWGNVNPLGPRAVYDEAKRFAEALTYAYHRSHGLEVRVARIFNTYGPRMRRDDGRAVPTFVRQGLLGEPVTVHGDGTQTRSLCYVDDLVDGILRLLASDYTEPVNLGNPEEVSVRELAQLIAELTGRGSSLRFVDRPTDDPQVRRPDTAVAERELGWRAAVPLREGLARTVAWFRRDLGLEDTSTSLPDAATPVDAAS